MDRHEAIERAARDANVAYDRLRDMGTRSDGSVPPARVSLSRGSFVEGWIASVLAMPEAKGENCDTCGGVGDMRWSPSPGRTWREKCPDCAAPPAPSSESSSSGSSAQTASLRPWTWSSGDDSTSTHAADFPRCECGSGRYKSECPCLGPYDAPRRIRRDKHSPAEKAITDAMDAVESMTADERLTDAVVLLGKARDSVADFIDGVPKKDTPAASARSDAEAVRDVRVFGGGQITNSIRRLIATLDDRELGPIVRSMPETVSLAEYLTKSLPLPAPSHESGIVAPCDHAVGVTFYGLPREGNTIDVLGKTFRFVEVKPESGVEKARRELAEAAGREELADYDSDEACGTDQFYVKRDEWTVAMDAVIQKRTELRAAERAAREGKV